MLLDQDPASHELGRHFKSDRNITSALSLPLRVGERCVGVLNVNRINHPEPFQEHHRDMLSLFAEHVGAVIDRAEAMDRLGDRSRQLEEDVIKLTEMNRMKDLFLSTASHELKTPLTSVIAYAELLDETGEHLKNEQRSEFLRRLRSEAERLLGLIEDILDLSRLESGKLALKRVPLAINEVAHAAVETSRSLGIKHGVELIEDLADDLPVLPLDEVKMRQVVVNLLVNAIKFSPDRAKVTVKTSREPSFLLVEVRDQGPGHQAGRGHAHLRAVRPGDSRQGGEGRRSGDRAPSGQADHRAPWRTRRRQQRPVQGQQLLGPAAAGAGGNGRGPSRAERRVSKGSRHPPGPAPRPACRQPAPPQRSPGLRWPREPHAAPDTQARPFRR